MVAGEQHRRDGAIAEDLGPRVLRILELIVDERLRRRGREVTERARDLAHDGVDDDERGGLTAREHVIADRELLVDEVANTLVHALVTAAQ
jgi:hypothetical protein